MNRSDSILFIIPALIWGSTWYVITYQLGVVDPIVSVSYRFGLAGILLLGFSWLKKRSLSFTRRQHFFIALQGLFLFGFNYWLVYLSEQYLSSGLVAVAFSTLIFLNIFFGALFLGDHIRKRVFWGAIAGLLGTILIYKSEFKQFDLVDGQFRGLLLCIGSILFASLGNITSAYNQRKFQLPVMQTNGFGMMYGALAMLAIALLSGKEISFDPSLSYILSLVYLSLFGSIIAFTAYLTLIGKIGPDRAAYVVVVIPLIALTISTIFEGYRPDIFAFLGMALIIAGNIVALRSRKSE